MPEIRPFRAITYNPAKIDDLTKVLTQPYDNIDPNLQEVYYKRSPYNFVRLILGKTEATDNDENNRYTRAKEAFESWMGNEGILIRVGKPAIYAYHQEFQIGDKTYERKGFVAVLKVEESGKGILPHERTLAKVKEDRFKLFTTTKKNFETIFMIYTDTEKKILSLLDPNREQPLIEVKDDFGCVHSVWKFEDPMIISEVQDIIESSTLFIADGHHRYETSLDVSKQIGGEGPHNYRMVTLVNVEDSGLVILPTHRMIFNLDPFNREQIIQKLNEYFCIKEISRGDIQKELPGNHYYIMVTKSSAHRLELRDETILDSFLPDRTEIYRSLDVTILHTLVIEKVLGIKPEKIEDHVRYEREIDRALNKIDSGDFQISFFMNPTSATQVKEMAMAGELMPQKSTDFYPKMISGLFIYDLEQ